jgi:hypothetical protein
MDAQEILEHQKHFHYVCLLAHDQDDELPDYNFGKFSEPETGFHLLFLGI